MPILRKFGSVGLSTGFRRMSRKLIFGSEVNKLGHSTILQDAHEKRELGSEWIEELACSLNCSSFSS
jgi:hypothetical protein